MSIREIYEDTKSKPRNDGNAIIKRSQVIDDVKVEVNNLVLKVSNISKQVEKLEAVMKDFEGLKLDEFMTKHKNMKDQYNAFVKSYNQSNVELTSVVMDLGKRVTELEL